MSHFSDGVQAGGAVYARTKTRGYLTGQVSVVQLGPVATASTQAIAIAATGSTNGGALSATGTLVATSSETQTLGLSIGALDVPRTLTYSSTGANSQVAFTVQGLDFYGELMTETVFGPTIGGTVNGGKAFFRVYATSVSSATAPATNIAIGSGNFLGLPFFCSNAGQLMYTVNGLSTTVTLTAGALTTVAQTATTADVRGLVSATNNTPDGTKVHTLYIVPQLSGSATQLQQQTKVTLYGTTQA